MRLPIVTLSQKINFEHPAARRSGFHEPAALSEVIPIPAMSSVVPVPWTPLPGVTVLGPLETNEQRGILSDGALALLAKLHRAFQPTRAALLRRRKSREVEIRQGKLPSFLPETAAIRNDPSWKGPNPAPGLVDRRVEITGPVDRKMIINALNSGASTFMADFEGKPKSCTGAQAGKERSICAAYASVRLFFFSPSFRLGLVAFSSAFMAILGLSQILLLIHD
jgi:hypothetical protein